MEVVRHKWIGYIQRMEDGGQVEQILNYEKRVECSYEDIK
jgi:hypothetical protein